LLSQNELDLLISHPLAALGSYYTRCLDTFTNSGDSAFKFLLPEFANLLGGFLASPPDAEQAVTGSGNASDPWQVQLVNFGESKPGAYLRAWLDGPSSPPVMPRLSLGLYIGVPVTIPLAPSMPMSAVIADTGFLIELLQL